MKTALRLATIILLASATAGAQSGPPPAPEPRMESTFYVPLFGGTAGIAIPAGKLSEDHGAGLALGALIEYAVAGQPYSLRGEALFQHYPTKSGHLVDPTNIWSLGTSIVYRLSESGGVPPTQRATGGPFVAGGIGVYSATHEGIRPGFNVGTGVEIPLTGFSAVAEARLHFILTDARAMLAIPLTVSVRF